MCKLPFSCQICSFWYTVHSKRTMSAMHVWFEFDFIGCNGTLPDNPNGLLYCLFNYVLYTHTATSFGSIYSLFLVCNGNCRLRIVLFANRFYGATLDCPMRSVHCVFVFSMPLLHQRNCAYHQILHLVKFVSSYVAIFGKFLEWPKFNTVPKIAT